MLCNTGILSDLEDREREGANFVSAVGDIFLTHVSRWAFTRTAYLLILFELTWSLHSLG